MNEKFVLDASALLTLLHGETGHEHVTKNIEQGAVMGTVNLSEVATKLSEFAMPEGVIRETLGNLGIRIIDFDKFQAFEAGILRKKTAKIGLSFGDRACLALAIRLQLPCVTADHVWAELDLPVDVILIR